MLHAYLHATFTQDSYHVPAPCWTDGTSADFACRGYGEYTGRGGFEWDNTGEDFWTVILHESGLGKVWINHGEIPQRLSGGDVFVLRPGAFYHREESPDKPWRYRWVVLVGARAGEVLESIGLPPDVPLHRLRLVRKLEPMFADMRAVLAKDTASLVETCELGWRFARAVASATPEAEKVQGEAEGDDSRVNAAIEWLRQHYQKGCSVEDAAKARKLSRSTLFRLLRAHTGQNPKAYLDHLRLEHAKHLLRQGGHTGKEVALRCGYRDHRHFAQAFTRKMGASPQAWSGGHEGK